MSVTIIATKDCSHRAIIENQLKALGVSYKVEYFEENPGLIQKYNIHHTPNILVDEEVVFRATSERAMPTAAEFEKFFGKK